MWNERRAERARRELAALGSCGLDPAEVLAGAAEVVRPVVPYDATCWATVDPSSNLLTGSVTVAFDPSPRLEALFAQIEAGGDDLHPFRDLMRAGGAVPVRLSDAATDVVRASRRVGEIYEPLGFGPELRTAFAVEQRCWGVAGLLREASAPDFTDDEVAFLGSVGQTVARLVRASSVTAAGAGVPVPSGPAVAVLAADGTVLATTPLAEERLRALERARRGSLAIALRSVVGAVGVAGAPSARVRVRDGDGAWVSLSGSPLRTGDGDARIALTIEPLTPVDLVALLLDAHGLSGREREVCDEVLAGRSTAEIAAALYISQHTVQDHLKSVFAKTGVRSRRELVAYLAGGR